MSYHNGSVWPHDTALIALGLARYGLKAEVFKIFRGMFEAAEYMDLRRLPELFCGFPWRRLNGRVRTSGLGKRRGIPGGKGTCPSSCRVEGSKADVQIRDDGAEIGLGLGRPLPKRVLHPAYARSGPLGHRAPRRRFWQCPE
jgi:hypothetical protein